ncbi:MAG: D-aminoacylase [Halobacteriales archaeon]|nr:D-aminoacylase [Halobacteriales archaeon]
MASGGASIEFQHATILDGSGGDPITGHVHIDDGRIQRISATPGGADRVIDLDGRYLAPGFIDMHAHSELRLLDRPDAAEKVTQGVTLEVLGQDGVSVAPAPEPLQEEWARRIRSLDGTHDPWSWTTVKEYLDTLDDAAPAVNCVMYAPHGNLRSTAAGFEDRPLDAIEIETLQDRLREAIDAGAFAMSKGMIYPPSAYARDDELVALAETLSQRNGFMVSHVWNESDRVVESIDRYIKLCEQGGCQPHISHLKVAGEDNWGRSTEVLEVIDAATDRDTRVTFDQYPWTAGSTMLSALLPPWARKGESADIIDRLEDPDARERIRESINTGHEEWENLAKAAGTWDNILLTHTASGQYEGETIADIAADRDADPIETLCDLLVAEDLDVTMADFVMDDQDIERFLADERGTICTDGIFGGKPHPRAVGTYPRLLGRYVRDRNTLSVETAVYKAAGHPADILGLPDRGRIREGYRADLVVFDLDTVAANATYENPLQYADGIDYVLVNGRIAVEAGEPTEARAGTVLRSGDEWGGPSRPAETVRRNGD